MIKGRENSGGERKEVKRWDEIRQLHVHVHVITESQRAKGLIC